MTARSRCSRPRAAARGSGCSFSRRERQTGRPMIERRAIDGLMLSPDDRLAAAAGGCATSRAQIPEQQPTLVVPPVPPRAIEPPPSIEPPAARPGRAAAELPAADHASRRPRAPADRAKPDPKQEPPVETVPTPPTRRRWRRCGRRRRRAVPRPRVRFARSSTARSGCSTSVDYPKLSDDRKANFTSAKAFMQQAEEALKKEELTQARSFAERAQNIAKLLLSGSVDRRYSAVTSRDKIGHSEEARAFRPDCPYLAPAPKKRAQYVVDPALTTT